jgi:hypothetical protein
MMEAVHDQELESTGGDVTESTYLTHVVFRVKVV